MESYPKDVGVAIYFFYLIKVKEQIESVTWPLQRISEFLSFTVILIILEAWWYKRNYRMKGFYLINFMESSNEIIVTYEQKIDPKHFFLLKEHYDNHYITGQFKALDSKRKENGERHLGKLHYR